MTQTTTHIISPHATDVNRLSLSRCSRVFGHWAIVLVPLFLCGCGLQEYEKRLDASTREYRRIAAEVEAKKRLEAKKLEKEQGGPRPPGARLQPPAPVQPAEQPPAADPQPGAAPDQAAPGADAAAEEAPAAP